MSTKDVRSALGLALLVVLLIVSLVTGFMDTIIVPTGLFVFGILAIGFSFWFVFSVRRYSENHPYIPYVGKLAHVLCPQCMRSDLDSRIEVEVGTAFEGWTRAGHYFRGFRREYTASCERGHKWTYDPFLERNEIARVRRAPLTEAQKAAAKLREAHRARAVREGFHNMIFGEPEKESDS